MSTRVGVENQFQVEVDEGVVLQGRLFEPTSGELRVGFPTLVLSHPHSKFGGSSNNMKGLAKTIAEQGIRCVTFDFRGVRYSSGTPTWLGWGAEVVDCVRICEYCEETFGAPTVLLGSSGGAPIAGSGSTLTRACVGSISIGYTFGFFPSLLWGGHFKNILRTGKPRLWIMGSKDQYTSVSHLKKRVQKANGTVQMSVVENVGHFELEQPAYERQLGDIIVGWIEEKLPEFTS